MAARIQSGVVVCLVLLISSFPHTTANAQTTNATLNGQVTDTSGAAVPNAKVVVVNDATNVRYETKTNNDGIYVEPNLPPGTYHIEITKEGFKTVMQPGIELHVEDARSANYTLQVGATSETVTVQARSYMINTQDAAVSTTIDRNFAENLPLNGRSFQTLILLTPGTVLTTADSANSNGGQFSVNGQRANANSFTVDGVSANVGGPTSIASTNGQLNGSNPGLTALGTTQGLIAVDALQEFKIQSSTYAPEFGRQPGGQISLLTRSGTNEFHGTAFDYLRNDIFDANNWFNDAANPPRAKGKERQNDFGGTIGGRIFQDKTFFFLSYEGLRLLQPVTFVDTVPSLRLRKESAPAYQAVLNSWPIPGGPESVDSSGNPTGSAPYTFSSSAPTNLDSYSVKIDHTIGSRLHLFGRYAKTTSASAPFTQSNETFANTLKLQTVTLGLDAARGANLSNEMRINYTLNKSSNVGALYLVGGATGFDESPLFPAPLVAGRDQIAFILSLPLSNFSLNLGSQGRNTQRQANLVDSVSYSRASHQIKSGIDYRRLFPTYDTVPLAAGYFPSSENDLQTSNLSFTLTQANVVGHPIFTSFSAYMQDTWRVSSRLTLTYGLRWELNFAPGERDGDYPPNVIGISNPATATIVPSAGPFKTTYGNFAPRVGLAFQARQLQGHETVVRGGLGVFYDLNTESYVNGFREGVFQNFSPVFTNVPFPVANNFFAIPPLPAPLTLPLSFAPLAIDPHLQLPYTLQWNASVEQGLGNNQSLLMSYVASAGYRLLRSDNLFNFGSNFPLGIQALRNASSSNYQSLQLQFNRRLSQGLQALASYTYSHSIDNASDAETVLSTSSTGSNFLDPNLDRGNSDFDIRHTFRGAATYNIPAPKAKLVSKAVLGGWSLDTIAIAQTGPPVNLVGGNYFINGNLIRLRPNVVSGQPRYLFGAACAAAHGGASCPGGRGFNPSAFAAVPTDSNGIPTQQQGTLGRNVMRGLGAWQMDFALHRQFNLTEKVHLQFRSEFFNIFNHPNFSPPNNSLLADGQFGLAGSTLNRSYGGLNSLYQIGGPRSIQLVLKLQF